MTEKIKKTKEEWKSELTHEQYEICHKPWNRASIFQANTII